MELVHIYKDGYPNGIEVMPHTYTALRVCHFFRVPYRNNLNDHTLSVLRNIHFCTF
uniref:Uncharacterized protein n=1 Tax=Anguilla anguilla TaxID=7936 RepID=A0A0E9VYN2_ANGAN